MQVLLHVNGKFWKERKVEILGAYYIQYVTIGKPKFISWRVSRHYDYSVKFEYKDRCFNGNIFAEVNDPRLIIDEKNHLYAKEI